jgi:ATP-binding cassette subfamily G (WHITE) protein 2 (PDR)
MICDLPNKIGTAIGFNLTLYFMTNLRRTPGHFFVFLLFSFTCTLTMSMYFRCIAALSRTFPQVGLLSTPREHVLKLSRQWRRLRSLA